MKLYVFLTILALVATSMAMSSAGQADRMFDDFSLEDLLEAIESFDLVTKTDLKNALMRAQLKKANAAERALFKAANARRTQMQAEKLGKLGLSMTKNLATKSEKRPLLETLFDLKALTQHALPMLPKSDLRQLRPCCRALTCACMTCAVGREKAAKWCGRNSGTWKKKLLEEVQLVNTVSDLIDNTFEHEKTWDAESLSEVMAYNWYQNMVSTVTDYCQNQKCFDDLFEEAQQQFAQFQKSGEISQLQQFVIPRNAPRQLSIEEQEQILQQKHASVEYQMAMLNEMPTEKAIHEQSFIASPWDHEKEWDLSNLNDVIVFSWYQNMVSTVTDYCMNQECMETLFKDAQQQLAQFSNPELISQLEQYSIPANAPKQLSIAEQEQILQQQDASLSQQWAMLNQQELQTESKESEQALQAGQSQDLRTISFRNKEELNTLFRKIKERYGRKSSLQNLISRQDVGYLQTYYLKQSALKKAAQRSKKAKKMIAEALEQELAYM